MKHLMASLITCSLLLPAMATQQPAHAEDHADSSKTVWPQWRGPYNNGVSYGENIPASWSKTENVIWRTELPGEAGATPVIWEDRIFLTSSDGDDLLLMCLNTDGEEQWRQVLGTGDRWVRRDEGNAASPSPSTDGQHVWAMMTTGDLGCYTLDGELVWKKNLQEEYGRFNIQFGMASSPLFDNGRLYLQLIHGEMRDGRPSVGWVICLDAESGDEVWRHRRETEATVENKHSYASPIMYRDDQREFLLTHGADYTIAHSLEDGSEIWRAGGFNPPENYNQFLRFVASPAVKPGLIVAPSAKNGPVLGLKPDLEGDVTNDPDSWHWRMERGTPDVPSPLIHDGLVYLCREMGIIICLDAETGEELYQVRVRSDRYRASPVYADGKVIVTGRQGVQTVFRAGREFEVLSENNMEEEIASSPVVVGDRLYLRTFNALYAIGREAETN